MLPGPYSIDAFKHPYAEIETAHVHRISPFPLNGRHLRMGLGVSRGTGCGGCRAVDRWLVVIVNELVLPRT